DSESSESESEEESEDEEEPPASNVVVESAVEVEEGPEVVTGEDPTKIQNLSKKERKALKQKQLDDLDALLGEFGVEVAPEETAAAEAAAAAAANGSAT
ncbi:unnamed protein product, partial [Hapterophycus canaliculatus]